VLLANYEKVQIGEKGLKIGKKPITFAKKFLRMTTKEQARQLITELVEKYQSQMATYQNSEYNETQTRLDFINPFFMALGWDMDNVTQKKESERDVKQEFGVPKDGQTKKVDYAFLKHKKVVFFLEAKKPSIVLKDNAAAAYQIRSYAWNKSLAISLLFNFAEFAIYDGTRKIREGETAASKRLKYIAFKEYLKEFNFLWETFAYENVLKGSLDKYIESKIDLKNTEPVDVAFLESLNKWRHELAQNILKNQEIDEESLNEVVQKNIDRIVFLRVCEDRGIEDKGRLNATTELKGKTFSYLLDYFKEADQKYNSGLFNFKNDQISPYIKIDNGVIKEIIKDIEKSNYKFDIIPIEILGYAYEQFLGKVIRLDEKKLIIEEKPEVRKAGGVYYTPDYIVNYIVENTLGKLIENKTPEEVAKIKVLDPSCGSGSFLLGAYDYLLNWHLDYYKKNKPIKKYSLKENPLTEENQLTIQEKKRILLNNIFGVDIDNQAVEVSKLSLLLKALENETEFTVKNSLVLFKERALPNIDHTILCGNSLIENDFYEEGLFLTRKEERKINAFDWKKAFPLVFEQGGFDCIIGNPPWGQKAISFLKGEKDYLRRKYPISCIGILDFFRFFIEKSFRLMRKDAFCGMVLPDIILLKNYVSTRKQMLELSQIQQIIHWGMAFRDVNLDTCTIISQYSQTPSEKLIRILIHQKEQSLINQIHQSNFWTNEGYKFNLFLNNENRELLEKLRKNTVFDDFFEAHEGIHTGNIRQKLFLESPINKNCKKLIFGKNGMNRYFLSWENKWVHYDKNIIDKSQKEYAGMGKREYFESPKLVVRRTGDFVLASIDTENYYFSNNVFVCLPKKDNPFNLKFVLGLLNSKLMTWFYRTIQPRKGKLFAELKINLLSKFPIPNLNLNDKIQGKQHEQLVKLVEAMLEMNKRFHEKNSQTQHDQIKRRIQHLDQEIDNLVYQLYDLNETEIALIEGENV